MPTTATLPLPVSPAHGASDEREHAQGRGAGSSAGPRTASMEERTSALEVRLEVLIPTLATKVEIIDLRAEMRNLENRLIKWVVGAAIALVAVFVTLFTYLAVRTDNAIEAQTVRTDDAIAAQATRTDNAIAELKADIRAMNTRIDRLDARIDRLDEKIDARFDALMAEIRAQGRAAK